MNNVLGPLHVLHVDGHELPRVLAVDPGLFTGQPDIWARFNPGADPAPGIEVNPDPDLWSPERFQRDYELHAFSTAHPHGTVSHEYLHFRIHARSWITYTVLQGGVPPLQAEVQQLAEQVSDYAAGSALEFVSEVYAALRTGHEFAEEVLKLYRAILRFAGLEEDEV